jgi:hypothetical protein
MLFADFSGCGINITKGEYLVGDSVSVSGKKVRLNAVCRVLDRILIDKEVLCYRSDASMPMICVREGGFVSLTSNSGNTMNEELENMAALTVLVVKSITYNRPMHDAVMGLKTILSKPDYWEEEVNKTAILDYLALLSENFYKEYKTAGFTVEFKDGINMESAESAIAKGFFKPMEFMDDAIVVEKEKKVEVEKKKETDVFNDFKIEYSEWTEEQLNNIPKAELDSYIVTPQSLIVAKKIKFRLDEVKKRLDKGASYDTAIGNDYVNLLLVGSPGTGKTKMLHAIAEMCGMPIYTIPISKNTEEDVFEGKNKVIEGKIAYVETDFIKAYENGGIIVLEEINLADPAVIMGSIGQAMERPFVVKKDGYINIRRHPMCVIVATMNTGTAGSKKVNQALSSRFKQTITLEDPTQSIFTQILFSHYPKKTVCKWVYNAYQKIKRYLASPDINREDLGQNLSMRACFGALENIEEGQDGNTAIVNSIVGKIAENDLDIANQVIKNVVDNLPEVKIK